MRFFCLFICILLLWACQKDKPATDFFPSGTWEECFSNFPLPTLKNHVCFNLDDAFYVGLGTTWEGEQNRFFCYRPTEGWTEIKEFPGRSREDAVAFVLDGKAYVGLGRSFWSKPCYSDFWIYDPEINSWDSLRVEFPGRGRSGALAFEMNHCGYVGTGFDGEYTQGDFFRFSPESGWITIPTMFLPRRFFASVFKSENAIYLCCGKSEEGRRLDVYKFLPEKENWVALQSLLPKNNNIPREKATAIVMNKGGKDYVYLIGGNYNCWSVYYNPQEDCWIELKEGTIPLANIYFEIKNELYLVIGNITKKFIPTEE